MMNVFGRTLQFNMLHSSDCWSHTCNAVLVMVVIVRLTSVSAQEEAIISGNDKALKTSSAELTCTYSTRNRTDEVARLTWRFGPDLSSAQEIGYYLNTVPEVTYGDGYGPPDYVISTDAINVGSGSSVLSISNVDLDKDEGTFWCQVLVLGYSFFSDDQILNVNVLDTSATDLLWFDGQKVVESSLNLKDGEHTFECRIIGAKPAPTITWTLGETIDRTNTDNEDPRLTDSVSRQLLTINSDFGAVGKDLTCTATVPADEIGVSDTVTITRVVTTPTKNVGAIVGGVFGGIVVIGGVVGGVVYVCVYKEKN